MTTQEVFLRRVHALVDSLAGILTSSERAEVVHLVDHNEIGEALRTLAWVIVDENKRISRDAYNALQELSKGLVTKEQMPGDLAAYVEPTDSGDKRGL